MGGRGSSSGAAARGGGGGFGGKESENQFSDAKHYAQTRGATAVRYTDKNGNEHEAVLKNGRWSDEKINQSGGIYTTKYSDDVARYARMKPEQLRAELKTQQAISNAAYQTSTRVAASKTGSQVSKFAEADAKIKMIKQVLRRK